MKYLVRFLVIACILGVIGALAFVAYYNVFISRLEVADFILSWSTYVLFGFLMVLVVRYLALLLLSFLYHVRHMSEPLWGESYPPVSVLIPAYNEGVVVESAIRSIMALDYPQFEAIVIDDGSSDDTYDRALALVPEFGFNRLRVIRQANSGKSAALNAGIAQARGEFVLCVDADSRLEPQSLREAMKHFSDPTLAAVAGNVKVANRTGGLTCLQALEYVEGLNLVRKAQSYFHRVTVIPGPLGVFRKAVLLEVGGYRNDTFAEDCELTLRLMISGHRIKYEANAIAWTEAPETAEALFKQRYRWSRGILQAILRHKGSLVRPFSGFGNWIMLWYMAFESLALPGMNLIGMLVFVLAAISGGVSSLIILWWAQLTLLDFVVGIYCVAMERERLGLTVWAFLYRLYFIPFIDVLRFFASIDELFSVRMGWMRLQRIGRI